MVVVQRLASGEGGGGWLNEEMFRSMGKFSNEKLLLDYLIVCSREAIQTCSKGSF